MNTPIPGNGGNQQPDNHAENERHAKIRRGIAESLILIVYVLFDVKDEWPKDRLSALIFAVGGISAVLLIELTWKKWAAATVALCAVALVILYVAPPVLPEETETHGWLVPKDIRVRVPCVMMPPNALLFILGTDEVWTTSSERSLVLNIANTDLLFVERGKDGLLFDMDAHDQQGNLIFRIQKNEFRLVSGTYSYQERSPDRSTIAVYDKKGDEMVYIEYLNPDTVFLRGHFFGTDGTEVRIDNKGIRLVNNDMLFTYLCKGSFGGRQPGFYFSLSDVH